MKQIGATHPPKARKQGLIVRELPDEVLIYDRDRDKAHCLNQTAALVWKYCDGETSIPMMVQHLESDLKASKVDEKIVWFALSQLDKDNLLEAPVPLPSMMDGMSRRHMMRALGLAAVIAIPVVTSIVAPTPAQAATCLPSGAACTSAAQCCSGLCPGAPSGTCS
jgi:hypothetical protein